MLFVFLIFVQHCIDLKSILAIQIKCVYPKKAVSMRPKRIFKLMDTKIFLILRSNVFVHLDIWSILTSFLMGYIPFSCDES